VSSGLSEIGLICGRLQSEKYWRLYLFVGIALSFFVGALCGSHFGNKTTPRQFFLLLVAGAVSLTEVLETLCRKIFPRRESTCLISTRHPLQVQETVDPPPHLCLFRRCLVPARDDPIGRFALLAIRPEADEHHSLVFPLRIPECHNLPLISLPLHAPHDWQRHRAGDRAGPSSLLRLSDQEWPSSQISTPRELCVLAAVLYPLCHPLQLTVSMALFLAIGVSHTALVWISTRAAARSFCERINLLLLNSRSWRAVDQLGS
jgi:hypothetical protein